MSMPAQGVVWRRHAWVNRLQTVLLMVVLLGISGLAGSLLLGEVGLWIAFATCAIALLFEPAVASTLTLSLYRARPIQPFEAPELWDLLGHLAERAELPATPVPHYVPSPIVNAFAVGNRERSAIALTDGLLRQMPFREMAGVLAHEVTHIAHEDLRVMGLADSVSRLTHLFSLTGQLLLFVSLPTLLATDSGIHWPALLLLVFSPHLALLAQLGLSRVREFDADLNAAALTGDPEGLARALIRIEQTSRSWRSLLLPGWGNPEPSWLRTHPATAERIRRLLELAPTSPALSRWRDEEGAPGAWLTAPVTRPPRWRIGGLWH